MHLLAVGRSRFSDFVRAIDNGPSIGPQQCRFLLLPDIHATDMATTIATIGIIYIIKIISKLYIAIEFGFQSIDPVVLITSTTPVSG